jgi:hypothetical protein
VDRQPPPDISLAIGDGARRMTYAELADVRGISRASAERQAKERLPSPDSPAMSARCAAPDCPPMTPDITPDIRPRTIAECPRIIETLKGAIDSLRSQLERERGRVDRAERLLEEEQKRIGELKATLADAVGAERIAAGEAAALRAELDRRRG